MSKLFKVDNEGNKLPYKHGQELFDFEIEDGAFDHPVIVEAPEFIIECSGVCEPNPAGIGAYGLTVACPHNDIIDYELGDTGRTPENTNNALEYLAVLYALIWVSEHAADVSVEIRSSSKTVVEQVNGNFRCNSDSLRPLYESAIELMAETKATLRWIPLKENQTAYLLARAAYVHAKKRLEAEGRD